MESSAKQLGVRIAFQLTNPKKQGVFTVLTGLPKSKAIINSVVPNAI